MNPTPRIESDTTIVARAIMEAVCEAAGVWLGQPLPRRWLRELTAHANTVYARNPRFRRKVRGQGNGGRDYLWAFARHWLAGLLWERRAQLHVRLPNFYSVGHQLPPKRSVPVRQRETAPGIPLPTRLRPRPAPDYALAAAAHFHFP